MKKVFLLTITAGLAISSFAQTNLIGKLDTKKQKFSNVDARNQRTTGVVHDTILLRNTNSLDTPSSYYVSISGTAFDSGYFSGMNFLGLNGFAERYDFKSPDSTLQVVGIWPILGGTVSPSSTRNLKLKVWRQSAVQVLRPTLSFNGIPSTVLDSLSVPFTALGVTDTTYGDSIYFFPTPTAYLSDSFFVGIELPSYTWPTANGDTLSLTTTRIGSRHSAPWYISGGDTMINNQNMALFNGSWADNYFQLSRFEINYFVWPIVNSKWSTASVNGIGNKDFTFFGNYPNPAVNSTNVRFSLAAATDVTIQVADLHGRTIKTINHNNLSAGEHIVSLETSDLAAGQYVYLVRTANGGGIASQLTVIK